MKTHIGLWLDHRKAVIVLPANAGPEIKVILSHADRQPGRIDGERSTDSYESLLAPADDKKDRRFGQHLATYYDEVIACVHEAGSLLILGPGEAKGELEKRLALKKHTDRSVTLETADKMTDRQIAAKVHEFFETESPVIVLS